MNTGPVAIFRADASPDIGAGHVMRCLTLADALAENGWKCYFACCPGTSATATALSRSGHEIRELEKKNDPNSLRNAWPDGCDFLVVDHYGLNASFERPCRKWAKRILVIDDLADRAHDCDVLVDQTAGREASDYDGLVPPSCRVLVGSAYALVGSAFSKGRHPALESRETLPPVRRLLIGCGATDRSNVTATALKAVAVCELQLDVDVVLASTAPHLGEIRKMIDKVSFPCRLHVDTSDMAGLMAGADLAIGAAGTSTWERCCLGLPTLTVVTADNQRKIASALEKNDGTPVLGEVKDITVENMAAHIHELAGDPRTVSEMAKKCARLCDGLGAKRVVMALNSDRTADGGHITLRPADRNDAGILFSWQRHPETRRHFRNPDSPDSDEHAAWMDKKLADPGCLMNMIVADDKEVGIVRLDRRRDEPDKGAWVVSILIDPSRYGQGHATAGLRLVRALVPDACLLAEVLSDNPASHRVFSKVGYEMTGEMYRQPGIMS